MSEQEDTKQIAIVAIAIVLFFLLAFIFGGQCQARITEASQKTIRLKYQSLIELGELRAESRSKTDGK